MQALFDYSLANLAVPKEESMAIRNEDWKAINTAIDDAIATLKPRGWKKALHILREWSVLGATATVIIALLALAGTAFYQAVARVERQAAFETNTTRTLEEIRSEIKELRGSQTRASFTQEVIAKPNQETAKALTATLQTAKKDKISLPPDAIDEGGKKFIAAATKIPEAWNAALAFLDYRSYLNVPPPGAIQQPGKGFLTAYTAGPNAASGLQTTMQWIGHSLAPDVPQYRRIDSPDLNKDLQTGPDFLLLDNAKLLLDGMFIKKVVFRDSHIIYKGGSVILENVYFVNCTFEIVRQPTGQSLAEAVLASSPAVTFKAA
jgi:hypothetical protein